MIEPAHIRMAWQSAVGRDIRFPSPEFDEYIAKVLNAIFESKVHTPSGS